MYDSGGTAYGEVEGGLSQLQDDISDERGRLKASLFGNKKRNTQSQK